MDRNLLQVHLLIFVILMNTAPLLPAKKMGVVAASKLAACLPAGQCRQRTGF